VANNQALAGFDEDAWNTVEPLLDSGSVSKDHFLSVLAWAKAKKGFHEEAIKLALSIQKKHSFISFRR